MKSPSPIRKGGFKFPSMLGSPKEGKVNKKDARPSPPRRFFSPISAKGFLSPSQERRKRVSEAVAMSLSPMLSPKKNESQNVDLISPTTSRTRALSMDDSVLNGDDQEEGNTFCTPSQSAPKRSSAPQLSTRKKNDFRAQAMESASKQDSWLGLDTTAEMVKTSYQPREITLTQIAEVNDIPAFDQMNYSPTVPKIDDIAKSKKSAPKINNMAKYDNLKSALADAALVDSILSPEPKPKNRKSKGAAAKQRNRRKSTTKKRPETDGSKAPAPPQRAGLMKKDKGVGFLFDLDDSWCQLDLYDDESGPLKGIESPSTTFRKERKERVKPSRTRSGEELRLAKRDASSSKKEKRRGVGRSKSDMGPETLGL